MKYPKPDTGFGKKNGLDIDCFESGIYQNRPRGFRQEAYNWLMYIIIGVLVSLITFIIEIMEE